VAPCDDRDGDSCGRCQVISLINRSEIAFNPPDTLEQAKALYEHYGIETEVIEEHYPTQRPQ
jgi:hypothetical protein